ncbi:MAG: carboxypeptidase regulatory-like domain-containing protein [Myxococcota bacterium]
MNRCVFVSVAFCLAGPSAWAYETAPVKDGATVTGRVTLSGTPAQPERAKFPQALATPDRTLCDTKRPLITPFYDTGPEGELAHVVVWIEGVRAGKPLTRSQGSMINEDCRFLPHVQTLDVGAKVQVENQDPIFHNTHAIYQDQPITAFNLGMPRKGQVALKRIRRPGTLKIQCDAGHTWMRAWIHAFQHPYHDVTGADGRFEIADVPAGEYVLHFWHENSGTLTRPLALAAGGTSEQEATFEAKPLPKAHAEGIH